MAPREDNHIAKEFIDSSETRPKPEPLEPSQPVTIRDWLKKKRETDDIGDDNLWRIHDDLYDFTEFMDKHPGGRQWLEVTRGLDITESFEASHVFADKATSLLKKYHVRSCASSPRKSRFTFHPDGFFKTVQRRGAEILKKTGTGPSWHMLMIQDGVALAFHLCLLMIILTSGSNWYWTLGAGVSLGLTISTAHNFYHQRTSYFRRYYFDFSIHDSFEALMEHCLTHHMFTNTFQDLELTGFYPLANLASMPKNFAQKHLAFFYMNIVFFISPVLLCLMRLANTKQLTWRDAHPILQFTALLMFSGMPWTSCLLHFLFYHCFALSFMLYTAGLAIHHHTSTYHPGDHPCPQRDWGLHQLDATIDVDKKRFGLFLASTTFGDHCLHHFFPTVDHSKLHQLYPMFQQTCREFGLFFEFCDPMIMAISYKDQLKRETPNTFQERMETKPL